MMVLLSGLPISPFFDRNNKQMAKCQIGFIQFIVRPLYTSFTELCVSLKDEILSNLNNNQETWEARKNDLNYVHPEFVPLPKHLSTTSISLVDNKLHVEGKEARKKDGSTYMSQISSVIEEEEEEEEDETKTHPEAVVIDVLKE